MSKHLRTLAAGAAIAAGLAAAPALYAQSYPSMPHGSTTGEGMMSGMINMMGMSGDMRGMMEHCGQMMQAMDDGHAHRPNDQWRSPHSEQPAQPRG
jgi:hypothetical protein